MPMAVNLRALGRRIRAARLARQLTLDDVVSRAEFTVSWLSKVENGLLAPSLEGLVRIAEILECGLEHLVAGLSATPRLVVSRREAHDAANAAGRRAGPVIQRLSESWPSRAMDPVILHVPATERWRAPDTHEGQRFLHVLDGSIRVAYGDEQVGLAAGDSAYLDAAIRLVIEADQAPAQVLCVSFDPLRPAGRTRRSAAGSARRARPKRG